MRIVSFINEAQIIRKILEHLQLWQIEHPGRPPPESLYKDMVDYLPVDDGWGDYKEPSIALN